MGLDSIQDDSTWILQQQIQQQALAQASTANLERVKETNANPQAIEQNRLVQNQQGLAHLMPGIAIKGEVKLDTNITKIKSESNYSNYQAIKDAKGNPWLVGTKPESKDFIVSPDFTRAYKLSNSDAVQNKLNNNEAKTQPINKPEASKASPEKSTLEQIKNDPKIKEATKEIEDRKNKAIKGAGIAAEFGTKALNYMLPTTTGALNGDAHAQSAKDYAENAMHKAMTPDFKTKEEKLQALNDVVMDHALNPAKSIAKLISSGNSEAEELGKAIHYLGQKEISPSEQAKYFQKMENLASPYIKQMEALAAKNDIQGMENLANDKKYSEVMNYYGDYHQALEQSGRAMNGFDAEVYRTLINKYK